MATVHRSAPAARIFVTSVLLLGLVLTGTTVSFKLCTVVTANETGTWHGGSLVQRDLTASGSCQRFYQYLPLVLRR